MFFLLGSESRVVGRVVAIRVHRFSLFSDDLVAESARMKAKVHYLTEAVGEGAVPGKVPYTCARIYIIYVHMTVQTGSTRTRLIMKQLQSRTMCLQSPEDHTHSCSLITRG